MKNFPTFSPNLLNGLKTTELKQPHPQGFLFVVPISWRFTVDVILPDIANVENQESEPIRIGEIFGMDTEWCYVQKSSHCV